MSRGIHSLFLTAAASAALIAGCGGSGNNNTTASTTTSHSKSTTTAAAQTSSTPSSHTSSTTSSAGLGISGAAVASYCQAALAAYKAHLSASQASQLQGICVSLAHDNPSQLKAAGKKLCGEITQFVPAAYQSLAAAECAKL